MFARERYPQLEQYSMLTDILAAAQIERNRAYGVQESAFKYGASCQIIAMGTYLA